MATMKEISDHFGVAVPTMHEYVKNHLHEINIDGEHAAQKAGKWLFDAVAVKRLEELRGFGIAGVIDELENQKIKDRDIMIANLQTQLLLAQQETNKALKAVAESEKERRMIAEKHVSEAAELAALRERTESQDKKERELKQEILKLNYKIEELSKPWWKRIFDME